MNKEKFLNKVTVIWGTDRDFKRSYFFETPKRIRCLYVRFRGMSRVGRISHWGD